MMAEVNQRVRAAYGVGDEEAAATKATETKTDAPKDKDKGKTKAKDKPADVTPGQIELAPDKSTK